MKNFALLLTFILLVITNFYSFSQNDTLKISIGGFKNSDSKAIIMIHDSDNSFPSDVSKAYRKYLVKIVKERVVVNITDLPKGRYAVVVCHDENSDNQLNTNFLGFPTEGSAIYNKNKGMPNFRKSCFSFPAINQIDLTIKYF